MSTLQNKIDFAVLISVKMANANGDPIDGNRPRIDYNGFGEISDVCIKRKIRNRMQDLGQRVFIQTTERSDDECESLSERASKVIKKGTPREEYIATACNTWLDVRSFGQVFAFKDVKGESIGIRGPVSIHQAASISPVQVQSMKITKSVNGEKTSGRASDTMGTKYYVRFGLYEIKGSINVQLAEKTGFSEEDAEIFKECLRTLFVNDASSARPDGSMEVRKLYWWKHNCRDGQYSSAKVHRSLVISEKPSVDMPSDFSDYEISLENLEGLTPEIIDGI